jgi:hypothetical protein
MDLHSVVRRRPGVALVALAAVAALLAGVLRADPADAGVRVMPGSFTGYAFDACQAPSQEQMDVWLTRSPYWGVGIYIAGENRYCRVQKHLDAAWVAEQVRKGWRLLPLTVGRQASCSVPKRWTKIAADPGNGYAKARAQGRAQARSTVAAARGYGIAEGSTMWLDLEAFDIHRARCRESALAYVSAWTTRLHDLGWRSGFYSSAASGIRMLDRARLDTPGKYALPDLIWLADWNQRADTRSTYFSADGWSRKRVHQYAGGHRESWGGVTLNIDSNFMDVGRGSVAPKAGPHCGVRREFASYRPVARGDRGGLVAALQCLLRQQRFGAVAVDGRFGRQTAAAVRRFQRAHGLRVTGAVGRRDWMVLLARGTTPLVKFGAANDAVRRVQRALNAAAGDTRLAVTGVFEATTRDAVKRYQARVAVPRSGVVTGDLWVRLQRGAR